MQNQPMMRVLNELRRHGLEKPLLHFERLRAVRADEHAALHALLECLGETLWQAQRLNAPPDERVYLECLERQR